MLPWVLGICILSLSVSWESAISRHIWQMMAHTCTCSFCGDQGASSQRTKAGWGEAGTKSLTSTKTLFLRREVSPWVCLCAQARDWCPNALESGNVNELFSEDPCRALGQHSPLPGPLLEQRAASIVPCWPGYSPALAHRSSCLL